MENTKTELPKGYIEAHQDECRYLINVNDILRIEDYPELISKERRCIMVLKSEAHYSETVMNLNETYEEMICRMRAALS